jgi:hypothetical protein
MIRLFLVCSVIASEAKQSSFLRRTKKAGLLRRFAPRNDAGGYFDAYAVSYSAACAAGCFFGGKRP